MATHGVSLLLSSLPISPASQAGRPFPHLLYLLPHWRQEDCRWMFLDWSFSVNSSQIHKIVHSFCKASSQHDCQKIRLRRLCSALLRQGGRRSIRASNKKVRFWLMCFELRNDVFIWFSILNWNNKIFSAQQYVYDLCLVFLQIQMCWILRLTIHVLFLANWQDLNRPRQARFMRPDRTRAATAWLVGHGSCMLQRFNQFNPEHFESVLQAENGFPTCFGILVLSPSWGHSASCSM